jgi:hypothetical protein
MTEQMPDHSKRAFLRLYRRTLSRRAFRRLRGYLKGQWA